MHRHLAIFNQSSFSLDNRLQRIFIHLVISNLTRSGILKVMRIFTKTMKNYPVKENYEIIYLMFVATKKV